MSLYNIKKVHMKYLFNILLLCLSINCFAEEILPPEPSEPDGTIGGHEYVDLGLPSGTLWATCNVGATSPYEKGQCFAWGEVEPREDFSWQSYKFFKGVANGGWAILEDIGSDISGTEYDAARHQWGNGWRLPNEKERYELKMRCWAKLTTENGVNGYRIYGPNEHNIFLPLSGFGTWYGEKNSCDSIAGGYWTGADDVQYDAGHNPIEPSNWGWSLFVNLHGGFTPATTVKAYGLTIRAVVNPRESGIEDVVSESERISIIYRDGNIHVKGSLSEGRVSVFDLSGRLIHSANIVDGVCQLPEMSKGIYIVKYTCSGNMTATQKITIK